VDRPSMDQDTGTSVSEVNGPKGDGQEEAWAAVDEPAGVCWRG
jgi:hypothetical protein